MRRHGTIFILVLVAVAACGSSRKEVESARHSLYDTDFAIVYSAALEATRDLYPNLDDNPGPGKIQTSWHQVQYSNCAGAGSTCDDMVNQRVIAQQQGVNPAAGGAAQMAGMPTRLAYKRYFIRFEIHVLGGRPWRVKVKGHASSWDPGAAMPVELKGADKPHWLDGRTEALQVAIWKKIRQYAIAMKEETNDAVADDHGAPTTDPTSFKNMPPLAAKELAAVKDALARRDYAALKPLVADDVVWSLGGGTGAEAAMAMWQADPTAFDAMTGTLGACVAEGQGQDVKRVACPGGTPATGAWQLVIEPRGDFWRVTSFVKAE